MTPQQAQQQIKEMIDKPHFKLIAAINILSHLFPGQTVTAIQFEDGSHKKFNFTIDGGKWQFIDLSNYRSL